jgi:hypothetical protein
MQCLNFSIHITNFWHFAQQIFDWVLRESFPEVWYLLLEYIFALYSRCAIFKLPLEFFIGIYRYSSIS